MEQDLKGSPEPQFELINFPLLSLAGILLYAWFCFLYKAENKYFLHSGYKQRAKSTICMQGGIGCEALLLLESCRKTKVGLSKGASISNHGALTPSCPLSCNRSVKSRRVCTRLWSDSSTTRSPSSPSPPRWSPSKRRSTRAWSPARPPRARWLHTR